MSFSCKFLNCWCIFNDDPYFGGNTYVGKAWNGEIDDVNAINAYGLQSFQVYGNALQKQCKMIRYHVTANGIPTIYGNVNVDYDTADSSAVLGVQFPSYGVWDSGNWDASFWGADQVPIADWQGVVEFEVVPVVVVTPVRGATFGRWRVAPDAGSPGFEAGRGRVGRKGIVRDPAVHAEVLDRVIRSAAELGFELVGHRLELYGIPLRDRARRREDG
mgnify:CR=1 FL=1